MKQNLKKKSSWIRIIFIIIYAIIWVLSNMLMRFVIFLNAIYFLFTSVPNKSIKEFGKKVSDYINELLYYLTFNSDKMPFPFADEI